MDKALKQRLVGATVLIALAVIVLPMLLGGRSDQAQPQSEPIELPTRPDGLSFETRRFPLAEATPGAAVPAKNPNANTDQAATSATPAAPVQDAGSAEDQAAPGLNGTAPDNEPVQSAVDTGLAAAVPDEPGVEGLPPVQSVELDPEAKVDLPVAVPVPAPASDQGQATTAVSKSGRYAVQVASLGNDANARKLQATLEAKGYAVIMDRIESDVGRLNRVRVGPYDSEAEAAAAVNKIRSQVEGVNPRMVDLDPTASGPVTTPSDPLVRWVVQLGSFGEDSNAENLVKQVREMGLSAYSEKVTSSAGVSINRVRVGPFLQREEASKAQQSMKASLNIAGVVMSAD